MSSVCKLFAIFSLFILIFNILFQAVQSLPINKKNAQSSRKSNGKIVYSRYARRRQPEYPDDLYVDELYEVFHLRRKPSPHLLNDEDIDRIIRCDFDPSLKECEGLDKEDILGKPETKPIFPKKPIFKTTIKPTTTTTTTTTTARSTNNENDFDYLPFLPDVKKMHDEKDNGNDEQDVFEVEESTDEDTQKEKPQYDDYEEEDTNNETVHQTEKENSQTEQIEHNKPEDEYEDDYATSGENNGELSENNVDEYDNVDDDNDDIDDNNEYENADDS